MCYLEENRGLNLEIPYLLTVLLPIHFDILPWQGVNIITLQSLTLRTKIILELKTSSFQKFKSLRTAITQRSSTKSHSTISSSNTTLRQDIIQPQRCSNLNIMRTISSSILLLGFATAGQVQSDKLQRQSINHAALPTSSVINQHAKSRTGRDLHMSNYPLSQEGAEREVEGRSKT